MVLLKIKFTQQRRVHLAQGLWLLSWMAVMSGGIIFFLGVYLKTELLRRSEVGRGKYTHTHTDDYNANLKTLNMLKFKITGINSFKFTQTWV